MLLFALTATVVLANLLIALISYHFQPEKVRAGGREWEWEWGVSVQALAC